uniref:Uncharacterized protein n=1 Tax=Romanomermis culicivorax TaxID=13658 RepID=A0A915IAY0_ROMCU
ILDKDHRVTFKQAEIVDFAQTLRDGVLLCQLVNKLCKESIDMREVSLRPQLSQPPKNNCLSKLICYNAIENIDKIRPILLLMILTIFLCLKNICLFLDACQKNFGLKQSDLFEAGELYKVSDFGKVLSTLSRLSTTPQAAQSGVKGFPENFRLSTADHDYYNQAIYKDLAEVAETKELEEEVYDRVDEDAKIYDRIIGVPKHEAFQPKDKRQHCIKELLDTEKNYVDALRMLYQLTLRQLLQVHTAFQSDLINASKTSLLDTGPITPTANGSRESDNNGNVSVVQRIGDVFVRWKEYFVCYSTYCSKLPKATARIDQLCSDSASVRQKVLLCVRAQFAEILNEQLALIFWEYVWVGDYNFLAPTDNCPLKKKSVVEECQIVANANKFRLQDVLSVPVQRVLKYHLLLKEMVKHTPDSHPDYVSSHLGLEAMLDLSLYINEVKRDCETLQIIRDIQRSIIDLHMPNNTELCDYGKLLKDGELKVSSHGDNDRRAKNRYVFVFDRVLLICKSLRASHYSYKNFLLMDEYRIEDVENTAKSSQTLLNRGYIGGII